MRFAVLHVARGDQSLRIEHAGIIMRKPFEQTGLAASRNDYCGQPIGDDLSEQFLRSRHAGRLGIRVEEFALSRVEAFYFFGIGVAVPGAAREEPDGAKRGAPLIEIDFFGTHLKSGLTTNLCPSFGVAGHGVEEHAVHVEKGGLDGQGVEIVAGGDGFAPPIGVLFPILGNGRRVVLLRHGDCIEKTIPTRSAAGGARGKETSSSVDYSARRALSASVSAS